MHKNTVFLQQFLTAEALTIRIIDIQRLRSVWHFRANILLQAFRSRYNLISFVVLQQLINSKFGVIETFSHDDNDKDRFIGNEKSY